MDATAHMNRGDLPGWFGKLPGMGDFAQRRLSEQFRSVWDSWLQHGLFELRNHQPDWVDRYLEGPVWFFALGPRLVSANVWLGVMVPSVDSAGRYFPLTLAIELTGGSDAALRPSADWAARWWGLCAQVAIDALESDLDANGFERALHAAFSTDCSDRSAPGQAALQLPSIGQSIWRTHPREDGARGLTWPGLPTASSFDGLFGCGEDHARAAQASR